MSRIVLGSGSPRRLELLSLLVDRTRIEVVRPGCDELGFEDAATSDAVNQRLKANTMRKLAAVTQQVAVRESDYVLCADTIVVACDNDRHHVLGKPDGPDWQQRVTQWFDQFYVRGPHFVRTGFVIARGADGGCLTFGIEEAEVLFRTDAMGLLPWYLSTNEPLGKAGGYGIQGAGSVFATNVSGSLSNVIGLPLEAVLATLNELQFALGSND